MRPRIWVFDLDDTLADTRHRAHLIPEEGGNGEQWVPYSMACSDDGIHPGPVALFKAAPHPVRTVIVTGRTERSRELTEAWLKKHDLRPWFMRMRGAGDHRGNLEIKLEKAEILREHFEIDLWVDDYSAVVQAISEMGIPTLHYRDGREWGQTVNPASKTQ